MIFFAYSTFKNAFDHGGYVFPWNPIYTITGTDANFHDVHHQSWGLKASLRRAILHANPISAVKEG